MLVLFAQIIKDSKKMVQMDGDISKRPLRLASSFGKMLYVRNNSNDTNKAMHVIVGSAKWEAGLLNDIEQF